MGNSSPQELTPDILADLEIPHEVNISQTAQHVVYTLCSDWNRPRGRWVSSIWIAEVGKQDSARQLTRGDALDSWPQFSPDGASVAFLSDRAKEGVAAIWMLDLRGGDAIPLTSTESRSGITKFAWSADGKRIAFLSSDENAKKQTERKAKDGSKFDAIVYGDNWEYARLRMINVATRTLVTCVDQERHVYDFVWSSDSKSIAFATQKTSAVSSADVDGTSLDKVELCDQTVTHLALFPTHLEDLCWVQSELWWRARYDLTNTVSSRSVYRMSVDTKEWARYGFGEKNCAATWALPPGLRKVSDDSLMVQVQSGLADQLHLLPQDRLVYEKMHEVRSFDAVTKDGRTTLAVVYSSADVPSEIYSIADDRTTCLSSHGKEVAGMRVAESEPFYAKAQDGTDLESILVVPKDFNKPKPWPTVVLVHGGPYQRVSYGFDLPYFNWSPWFSSAGYAVLCVNYRGGSSHGEAHTADLRAAAGTTDYSDTIDLVKAAIDSGIVDKDKVGIAGWSYGGYISFLAVTRDSTFHFQAAVCGAGITDWDLLTMDSANGVYSADIAGYAPWEVDESNTHARRGSPIWHMQDIRTPVLILHGEDDQVVPVSQSKAFHQGCLKRGVQCEMVTYPREGHGMAPPFERAHYVDMLERMKQFFDKHLGQPA